MTVKEALIKGNNLAATAIVSIASISFFTEFFREDEMSYKLDDGLLVVLGVAMIVWYRWGKNRFSRSIIPVLFAAAAFIIKLGGVFMEIKDADAGDDFGGVPVFLFALIFILWLYFKSKNIKEA